MATTLRIWPENVETLAVIDCSSPMSANTARKAVTREPGAAGTYRPAFAISASSPAVFSATVLPPVLGPVITSTDCGGTIRISTGTGGASVSGSPVPSRRRTAGISSGCRASSSSRCGVETSSGAQPPLSCANAARACSASISVAACSVRWRSAARLRRAFASSRRIRWTSAASRSRRVTISLLTSTVLSGSRNRLAPLPELPWTMPGIDPRCSALTTSTQRPARSITT